jgi:hypothetical protein
MTSIPDSHTHIFTRVPKYIDKTWSVQTRRVGKSNIEAEIGDAHSSSLIQCISIRVEFSSELTETPEMLDEVADYETEKITAWQAARREWTSIETAIHSVIHEITESQLERATSAQMKTVEILGKARTNPVYAPTTNPPRSALRAPPIAESIAPSYLSSQKRVRTIHPNESASVLDNDMTQMRSMLETIMEEKGFTRSSRSSSKSKKPSYEHVTRRRRS